MTRLLLAGFAALCAASSLARAGAPGYTAAEASRLRRAVTLENWDDGGDVSRFVYLHMSQIFPAAVVRRSADTSSIRRTIDRSRCNSS
jgi:hypothetical protein